MKQLTYKFTLAAIIALSFSNFYCYAMEKVSYELPNDAVLPLGDQEQLFVKAYESLNPEDIKPKITHVSGLEPMVRMHYSYVGALIKESPEHLDLLAKFWRTTVDTINNSNLTIVGMKITCMQLALLLTDYQKGILMEDTGIARLFADGRWKDIDQYDVEPDSSFLYNNHSSAMCYEAILCCPNGVLPYKSFVDTYISRPFVMHLSALSHQGKGPHGGTLSNPADRLRHDYSHGFQFERRVQEGQWALAGNPKTAHLNYWKTLCSTLQTIRRANIFPTLNNRASHYLVHEGLPLLADESKIISLGLPENETSFSISQRRLFLCAVAGEASYFPVGNFVSESFLLALFKMNQENNWLGGGYYVQSHSNVQSVAEDYFTVTAGINTFDHQMEAYKEVGTIAFEFQISPTENPFKSKLTILKAHNLTWSDSAGSLVSLETQQSLSERYDRLPYDTIINSRYYLYLDQWKDSEKMLRSFYKENCNLPSVAAPFIELESAVDKELKRFWRDFYLTNKHLFSDTEL